MGEKNEQKESKESKESTESTEVKDLKELKENKNAALTYKGKPLVRKDNIICYGDADADDYILTLTIKSTRDEKGLEIATSVLILIQSSDVNSKEIVKFGEKDSLYEAFEIGEIWLDSLKQGK
ncbi:MAG: hypothetical protein FWF92_08860 [Oscillospiraceae bacterium]|nr:hypothetical protein [Oscillospiraceae bacterium]